MFLHQQAAWLAKASFVAFSLLLSTKRTPAQDFPPAAVIVSEVVSQAIQDELELVGVVRPRRTSLVASESEGRVSARNTEGGRPISAGDTLLLLENAALRASLIEALADVRLRSFEHDRNVDLVREQAVSEQQLRQSEYELDRARSKLQALQNQIDNLIIRAPFSGHVVQLFAARGEWVGRGDQIAHIISTDTVRIHVNVPERHVDRLRVGDRAAIRVDALPEDSLDAHIVAILAEGYADAHTFPVIVEALNTEGRLRSNMAATVTFRIPESQQNLLVHKDAIVRTGKDISVFLAVNDTAVARSIEPGRPYGIYLSVSGNLEPGNLAIVRGNERLHEGQAIRVIRKLQ